MFLKDTKTSQKKKTEKMPKTNESLNSFLVETSFNSDIELTFRKEIEEKYSKSKMNSEYKFPRILSKKKNKSRQISEKNSFENLSKFAHKSTKSSANPLNLDIRVNEKYFSKKMIKFVSIPKQEAKKETNKNRGISSRQLKTDRTSKSPKHKKKLTEIYAKNMPFSCKKISNGELVNKIFTPYNSNNKLVNTASMRLKKIFSKVKNRSNKYIQFE